MLKSTTLCAAVALAVGFTVGGMPGPASAASLNSFTIDELSLGGTDGISMPAGKSVTADTIDFHYNTIISATNTGSFIETGSLTFYAYLTNGSGGTVQPSFLDNNCSGGSGCSANGYQMFANFTAHGTDTFTGDIFSFVVTSFTYDLYVTPNQATNDQSPGPGVNPCTQNANYQCSTTSSATAYLVASGQLSNTGPSNGSIPTPGAGVSQGTWGIYSTVNPGTLDTNFFASPSPFYLDFAGSGQNEVGKLTNGTNSSTITDEGQGFLQFAVPEPASMMLFGSGLLGLGLGALRRKTKKNA